MPSSTPRMITATDAVSDSTSADRRTDAYRRSAPRFSKDSAAVMTTAANADCGRSASNEFKKTIRTATRPAPTRPVTWLCAPDCSATAVREELVETANPCRSPAATFAAPMPVISWSGSTSSPRRAANAVEVAIVSVSETSVIPTAAMRSGHTSLTEVHGTVGFGNPFGSVPTVGMWSDSPNTADTIVAATTATSTAGILRVIRGSTSRMTSTAEADRDRRGLRLVQVFEERRDFATEGSRVGREPAQLGELPHDDRDGEPVHVPDLDFTRQEVGDEPEPAEPHRDLDDADQQGEHAGELDRGLRVAGRHQRDDRREDERRHRRVGSEHEDA